MKTHDSGTLGVLEHPGAWLAGQYLAVHLPTGFLPLSFMAWTPSYFGSTPFFLLWQHSVVRSGGEGTCQQPQSRQLQQTQNF